MITGQMIAMAVMFMVTVGVASLLLLPVTLFERKSKLINFYWCGFWMFLALIAGTAGGSSTMMIMGTEDIAFSNKVFAALISAFVGFVVIAWFHLCGKAALKVFQKFTARAA